MTEVYQIVKKILPKDEMRGKTLLSIHVQKFIFIDD